jgi:4-hydroxybenzoate polyprenyltransferase
LSASLRPWLALVRFGHSVFALPFALASAWLAARGMPEPRVLVLVVLCVVAARTAPSERARRWRGGRNRDERRTS